MNFQFSGDIVVGVDGSALSLTAVDFAADEGHRRQLPVHVLHASYPYLPVTAFPQLPPTMMDSDEEIARVDELVAAAMTHGRQRRPGVEFHSRILPGRATEILTTASKTASMVVVGSRGKGGIAELLLGSTASDLVTHTHCPAVVVRESNDPHEGPVFLGIDDSSYTEDAVDFAFEEASLRNAPLHAIHSWQPGDTSIEGEDPDDLAEGQQDTIKHITAWLRPWQDKYPDVRVRPIPSYSPSAAKPLTAASASASLVVVGSRMRGPIRARIMGATGHVLIHHAKCPVAIVPGHAHSESDSQPLLTG